MLKKTTIKLALSLLGASVISIILSVIIITLLGSIGAKSPSNTSSTSSKSGSSAISSASDGSRSSATKSTASSGSSAVSRQSAASSSLPTKSLLSEGGIISFPAGKVILGIICIMISLSLIYSSAWYEGSKDPNRVKYGHMNKFMYKGLIAGLLAVIPYAILTTAYLILSANAVNENSAAGIIIDILYRVSNVQYIVFSDAFTRIPVVCYMLLLVLPVISAVGYLAGYHNIVIVSKILYKNQKKPDGTYRKSISRLRK